MKKLKYGLFDGSNVIAKDLLEIGAVNFRPEQPYKYTSGRVSPIYVDVRRINGVPGPRARLAQLGSSFIYKNIGKTNFAVLAGGETAGIPVATLLADRMHYPMCYVRKEPKGFGRGAQIEGLSDEELALGRKFLLCEDLCSDGGSKRNFIQAIRKSGNVVTDIFVVYSYGVFGAEQSLADDGITLHSMVNAAKLVEVAEDIGAFSPEILCQIRNFLKDPQSWGQKPKEPTVQLTEPEAVE